MNTQIILVVDDALPNLHLLSVVLNRRGYQVITATSGAEALHHVSQTRPNLIILDMMLPDMDGFSVYQQLQANPSYQAIPVIFASALDPTTTLRQQYPELARVPWLAKPFMINELVQYVETALQSAAAAPPTAEQTKAIAPNVNVAHLAQPVWGTILIVDDTPDNLNLLSRILTEYGYTIRTAATGARALRSIASEPPDLILLDIMLPDLNGYEISKQIKQNSTTASIPIIFISALDSLEDKLWAFQMGGVDYITKPFQSAEVLARVHVHLMLRNSLRQLERRNQQLYLLNQIGAVGLQARSNDDFWESILPLLYTLLETKAIAFYRYDAILNQLLTISAPFYIWDEPQMFTPQSCPAMSFQQRYQCLASDPSRQCCRVGSMAESETSLDTICMQISTPSLVFGLLHLRYPADSLRNNPRLASLVDTTCNLIALTFARLQEHTNLYMQSIVDPVTGLFNQHYFNELVQREVDRSQINHQPVSVIRFELDHVARYTEQHGSRATDQILVRVGDLLRHMLRATDFACRVGVDDFAIVLPNTTMSDATQQAERLRQAIARLEPHAQITASLGVATTHPSGTSLGQLLYAVESAVQVAKQRGRNHVAQADPAQ